MMSKETTEEDIGAEETTISTETMVSRETMEIIREKVIIRGINLQIITKLLDTIRINSTTEMNQFNHNKLDSKRNGIKKTSTIDHLYRIKF